MWKKIKDEPPPQNKILKTKIDDENGVRNEQELKYVHPIWFTPDGKMYVYYTPTHWWDYTKTKSS